MPKYEVQGYALKYGGKRIEAGGTVTMDEGTAGPLLARGRLVPAKADEKSAKAPAPPKDPDPAAKAGAKKS